MPGPAGVPRHEIIALLQEGHSDRHIGRLLHTNPKRAAQLRRELELPAADRKAALTLEQTWATFTERTEEGHLAWTGYHREGTCPVLKYRGNDYTARRIAFRIAHQQEPVGRVLAGCEWPPCVDPRHVEDQQMRDQYTAIFGEAAA